MIPLFPNFKHIELTDKENIEVFTKQHPPFSDFNFPSLWSWDTDQKRSISLLNKNLVVRFTDYITGEPFYSFFGFNQVNETIEALLLQAEKEKIQLMLKFISAEVINLIDKQKYLVFIDRDNFDYVYSLEEQRELKGNKFVTKRNLINRLLKKFPGISSLEIHPSRYHDELIEIDHLWQKNKREKNEDVSFDNEYYALKKLLSASSDIELVTMAILYEGRLVAFCINELLPNGYAISHFAKADTSFSGIYEYLMKETAGMLLKYGRKYLNYEQDLGIAQLRYSKMSFRPIRFVEKFQVRKND
jgi:hypothetical protein